MLESGEIAFSPGWVDAGRYSAIEQACLEHGIERIKPLKDALAPEITFSEIRLVVANVRHQRTKAKELGN